MSKLGTLLVTARKRKNLSLRAVEKVTGISNAYLSQLENGDVQQPSPVMLAKLADLYEVPYATMLEYAGYRVPKSAGTPSSQNFAARIGTVTEDEESALLEYLEFLRTKRNRESKK
jgi:HTH-type transcriptional regulator, competence development regulator